MICKFQNFYFGISFFLKKYILFLNLYPMLFQFSLYGFLKNQRYFEPFLILFFLENGLNFTEIGILIGIREILLNLFEIPSGAFADSYGRRTSMIISFSSYIVSFIVFAWGNMFLAFILAMAFYALGDAFRTGTHKAMIFTWLRQENKTDMKTRYYGYTRSWSKFGSAFSLIIAALILYLTESYRLLFIATIIPYLAGIINFILYPSYLNRENSGEKFSLNTIFVTLSKTIKMIFKEASLRKLIGESIAFEGVFKSTKDYLQPILKSLATSLPLLIWLEVESKQKEAILIGLVYIILHLLAGISSRNANRFARRSGGETRGALRIWRMNLILFTLLIPLLVYKMYISASIIFVGFNILQNIWRPILISRFDRFTTEELGATILSVESQAKSLGTMIMAPLLGLAVDFSLQNFNIGEFWPVGILGVSLALPFIFKKASY